VLRLAALFSSILTAFIIQSYQTLQPDPNDRVVALLTKISIHTDPDASTVSFQPATSSLLCNVLWFTSLFLSLTCALLATLVDQWARGFTQKIEVTAAPVIRAKIFSYLYYGLRKFDMHTVVDLIPL
ncbi:hypothetical protein B0H11DRAFT_1633918, partial [Mycena galericulata]